MSKDVREFVSAIHNTLAIMDMDGKFHRHIMIVALVVIKQLQAELDQG